MNDTGTGGTVTSTFDLQALAANFPPAADTMLLDMRLTDEPPPVRACSGFTAAFRRIFTRRATSICRCSAVAGYSSLTAALRQLGPGQLLFFRRNVVHSIPEVIEAPLVVFSVDTPRRDPADVHFIDRLEGHGYDVHSHHQCFVDVV